jgi:hypothetical protein
MRRGGSRFGPPFSREARGGRAALSAQNLRSAANLLGRFPDVDLEKMQLTEVGLDRRIAAPEFVQVIGKTPPSSPTMIAVSSLRLPFKWRGNWEGIPSFRVYGPSLAASLIRACERVKAGHALDTRR